ERQAEAGKIAKKADLMLVIGGKNSANTKELAQICRFFTKTHHIESERDLRKEWLRNVKRVGIVTGASTPGEFIGRVKRRIKEELN
ncbi:MAG: bifunctional 4-hydroxy-3-methylbut-2-enyl diphosphate reductase/30S ribosomal protein S1, partial [Candidatus Omnitrophica bacterium]|nr:bifunctional 4-hydroxy-3-methylbut-2-enyl diphosphate reductase/30S ribosomal protein S1 [Candidatus Omnitrophota bacterium]